MYPAWYQMFIVAILQSLAKGNKEHPLNMMLEESSLYHILICVKLWEISMSSQLLGVSVLTKYSGSLLFHVSGSAHVLCYSWIKPSPHC